MNRKIKLLTLVIPSIFLFFISCNKEEIVDPRDEFVGTYKFQKTVSPDLNDCSCDTLWIREIESDIDEILINGLVIEKDPSSSRLRLINRPYWLAADSSVFIRATSYKRGLLFDMNISFQKDGLIEAYAIPYDRYSSSYNSSNYLYKIEYSGQKI